MRHHFKNRTMRLKNKFRPNLAEAGNRSSRIRRISGATEVTAAASKRIRTPSESKEHQDASPAADSPAHQVHPTSPISPQVPLSPARCSYPMSPATGSIRHPPSIKRVTDLASPTHPSSSSIISSPSKSPFVPSSPSSAVRSRHLSSEYSLFSYQ